MENVVIKNVPEFKKNKLKQIVNDNGYNNLSEFFRKIIDEIISQNNLDFLINDNLLNNLIRLNNLVSILIDSSNKTVENTSDIKKILLQIIQEME